MYIIVRLSPTLSFSLISPSSQKLDWDNLTNVASN